MAEDNSTSKPRSFRRSVRRLVIRLLLVLVLGCSLLAVAGPGLNQMVSTVLDTVHSLSGGRQVEPALAGFFTNEVRYWQADILRWAAAFELDPDLVATIIQIESCGDPGAVSSAGALGLMQVMPQYFTAEQTPLEPDTNIKRGLEIFTECLYSSYNPNRDIGLAFACYNGGPRVFVTDWQYWPQQSRDYYTWGIAIYADALVDAPQSPMLLRWLTAGGSRLCAAASDRLNLADG